MFKLHGARLFEAEHLAICWIDTGQHVTDGAVLAGAAHSLENCSNA